MTSTVPDIPTVLPRSPSISVAVILFWIVAGIALVAVAVALVILLRGRVTRPRIGRRPAATPLTAFARGYLRWIARR